MKNTVILLLFLLCVLGLIIGVYYTELDESTQKVTTYGKNSARKRWNSPHISGQDRT